jgi:hypothetical protein|tara:strand:+ start:20 stop:172 length:153 start_codon:yes stop_codon:yes gene_type:complete
MEEEYKENVNLSDVISYAKDLFVWVRKLNDMDRILLNRIEALESKIKEKE